MRRSVHTVINGSETSSSSGKFYILKDEGGLFWYVLTDHRDELLLRGSEGHSSRFACEATIPWVRENAPLIVRYVLRGFAGRYSFALKDANGRMLGVSDIHARERGRQKNIEAVQLIAPGATLVNLWQGPQEEDTLREALDTVLEARLT